MFIFQPTEFAKIGLVIFLASYLRDTRQVLVVGARRFLGVTIPPIKHFGPVLVIWGVAMVILLLLHDIGSSLMFYGALLSMLYVATGRLSFVVIGLLAFALGAWYLGAHIQHINDRVDAWLHPFNPHLYNQIGGSYQLANSIFAQAAGGLFGQGFGESVLTTINGTPLLPAPQTDMIYAVITDELGLFGAAAVLITYLLFVARGFKTAVHGPGLVLDADGRRPVGGVRPAGVRDRRRRDPGHPADRRDAALHLLRRLLDRGQLRPAGVAAARLRPRAEGRCDRRMTSQITKLFAVIVLLFALLIGWTSRWTVFDAGALDNNQLNVRTLIDQLRIKRGRILADDSEMLAISVPAGQGTWTRTYPTGPLFAQAVGYSTAAQGDAAGLELSLAPDLRGDQTGLSSVFGQFGGTQRVGNDVQTTLDPKAQQVAVQGLAGRAGSVVALDPKTGAILAMYANPSYDDNHPTRQGLDHVQPVHPGPVPAGLDLQGGDRHRGDRQRQVHPELDGRRTLPGDGVRSAAVQRQQPELRQHRPDHGTDLFGQHRVGPGGGVAGQRDDDQVHEAIRLLLQAPARLPRRARSAASRPYAPSGRPLPARLAPTRTSAASPSGRAACW